MILDTLSRCERYAALSPRFAAAFEYLKQFKVDQPDGRYDLDGDNCFALVQTYATKPLAQAKFESHRRYIDIQFIAAGFETMLWAPVEALQVTQDYAEEKDVVLYATPPRTIALNVVAGEFAIFHPEDGHAPTLEYGSSTNVRKVVIKVRV